MFHVYKFVRLLVSQIPVSLSSAFSALSMPTHLPSSQPGNSLHRRFRWPSLPPSALYTPSRDTHPEGGEVLSHPRGRPESLPEADHSTTADAGTLVHLADQLQLPLPPNCRRLRQEDLKIVGTGPLDAGGFADVWVGEMGDQAVAVKSYRCYASANCAPTYKVSCPKPLCVLYSPTTNR